MEFKKLLQKPLVAHDDMPGDMVGEAIEIITAGVDKFISTENYEKAAQTIKESLDKKFGPSWHVAIGEAFAYEIMHNNRNMLHLYYGERLGVLVFKC